jgi:hypothetical protein
VTQLAGRPLFKDVSVHRQSLGGRDVHIVAGLYCTGRPDPKDSQYHWRRAVFVATIPYKPVYGVRWLAGANASASEAVARYERAESPTVVDLLRAVSEARGLSYTNAWWDTYPAAFRVGAAVLVIGLLWPTCVNLIVFGKLTQPPKEKPSIDLSQVRSTSAAPASPAGLTDQDREQLADVEASLLAGLGEPAAPDTAEAAATDAPVKPLVVSTEPVVAVAQEHDDKHFEAKADDYYPTERGHRAHPHAPASNR